MLHPSLSIFYVSEPLMGRHQSLPRGSLRSMSYLAISVSKPTLFGDFSTIGVTPYISQPDSKTSCRTTYVHHILPSRNTSEPICSRSPFTRLLSLWSLWMFLMLHFSSLKWFINFLLCWKMQCWSYTWSYTTCTCKKAFIGSKPGLLCLIVSLTALYL